MKSRETGQLSEVNGVRGPRYCLHGHPVQAGDNLELQVESNRWIPVRYGWTSPDEPDPVVFAETGSSGRRTSLRIPPTAALRWAE